MQALDILNRARRQLHDLSDQNDNPLVGVYRWPEDELLLYINDGMREVAMHRPDSAAKEVEIVLAASSRQAIGDGYVRLIEVIKNAPPNGNRAIRVTQRDDLDRWVPDWHSVTGNTTMGITNYVYDERDPRAFWVYPKPAAADSWKVRAVCTKLPTVVTAADDDLDTHDIYMNPLLNYVLFRALTRDMEGNAYNRGVGFYNQFADAMGIKIQADMMVSPNVATTQRQPVG